jgi:serine/threonine protein phosphatase PrpC
LPSSWLDSFETRFHRYDSRMALDVDIGWHSARGPRENNEDFVAALRPAESDEARGLIAAIADGVSAGGGGREAAQTTVMTLLQDYFGTPETWDTSVALDRLIGAQNGWLAARNRRNPGRAAMTTLTAIVLRGHSYTLAHVGDSRAWLLRDGHCERLTQDHVFDHPDMRSRVTRAVGLDEHVHPDYGSGELRPGDVFVLTSDGVHGVMRSARFAELVRTVGDAQAVSETLVAAAVEAGTRDNASALVIKVRELASADLPDAVQRACSLPAAPRMKVGDELDGFAITSLLRDTGVHRLYQARDTKSGALVAIKTMHESRAGDPEERAMLAHEAWLGQRLAEVGGFVAVRERAGASALYVVFDWHVGTTLQQSLDQKQTFTVQQVVQGALAVVRALGRLHRLGVVHRDIKPGNLHFGEDGVWRVIDLGVAISGREPVEQRSLHAGTPSYMNPEQWDGEEATARSDLYALGVTLYQWLTGRLPYGEVEPYQRARFKRDPVAPSRLRPDVPIWLDHVVLKAVALDPRHRFETAEEFALALERGASRPLDAARATPLIARDPASLWKVAAAVSAVLNLLLIYWLLFLPR